MRRASAMRYAYPISCLATGFQASARNIENSTSTSPSPSSPHLVYTCVLFFLAKDGSRLRTAPFAFLIQKILKSAKSGEFLSASDRRTPAVGSLRGSLGEQKLFSQETRQGERILRVPNDFASRENLVEEIFNVAFGDSSLLLFFARYGLDTLDASFPDRIFFYTELFHLHRRFRLCNGKVIRRVDRGKR